MKFKSLLMSFLFGSHLFAQASPKIAVIGAGLSGLTAAYRLQEKGFEVDVYEARNRVGGRVFTVNVQGHIAELGAQNIRDGGAADHILNLIKDLELETDEKKFLILLNYFDNGNLTDIHSVFRSQKFNPETLMSELQSISRTSKNMQEVLHALFGEHSLMYEICAVFLSGYEGAPIEKLSTVYIETLYHLLMGGFASVHQSKGDENAFFDHMCVKGGNGRITETLAEKLNGRVHLKHALQKIDKKTNGSYMLTFQNGTKIFCDILILTIPCPTFENISFSEKVIPRDRLSAIQSIQYGTNAKILAPVLPPPSNFGAYTDGRIVTFLSHDSHAVNLYYTGDFGRFTAATIEDIFKKDAALVQQFYNIQSADMPILAFDESFASYEGPVGHSWPNDHFAKGSFSYIGAGQEEMFTSTIEMEGEIVKSLFAPISETLFFAGEHTSILSDVKGTMEAAVESGERTARLIEKLLSKK